MPHCHCRCWNRNLCLAKVAFLCSVLSGANERSLLEAHLAPFLVVCPVKNNGPLRSFGSKEGSCLIHKICAGASPQNITGQGSAFLLCFVHLSYLQHRTQSFIQDRHPVEPPLAMWQVERKMKSGSQLSFFLLIVEVFDILASQLMRVVEMIVSNMPSLPSLRPKKFTCECLAFSGSCLHYSTLL